MLLTSVALCIAIPAAAQDAPASEAPRASESEQSDGELIVTAQKREERLSDTPQTVNVVTGDQVNQYNLTRFEDITKAVPGLQISAGDGRQQALSLRGVAFDTDSGTNPTVDTYLNEVPLDPTQAINAQFDVGSIQVLRGPQGTLRGGTGPSGAVLIGTRQPSLVNVEANGTASYTEFNSVNFQGGVSMPLIGDVLGVRVAGLYDRGDGAQVQNIRNGSDDFSRSWGVRASVLFRPTDDLEFKLMHQEFRSRLRSNFQVISTAGQPVGRYGLIAADDRAAVHIGPDDFRTKGSMTILNATWDIAGNRLSYVGSYQNNSFDTVRDLNKGGALTPAFFGPFGNLPYEEYQGIFIKSKIFSHELRFERTGNHFWLYRFGVYLNKTKVPFSGIIDYTGTEGTCNQPGGAGPLALLGLPCLVLGETPAPRTHNRGYFTTQTFNFTDNATLDLGLRYSTSRSISASPSKFDAWTGSASFKHRFSDALLAYVSAGTSFRPGGFDSTGAATATIPQSIYAYASEKSKSVEVGLKGSLFDNRLFYSVAAYYQKFDNFISRVNGIACTGNPTGLGPTANTVYPTTDGLPPNGANSCNGTSSTNLTYNAPASSRGIEAELRGKLLPGWTAGLSVAYANAHFDNTLIPCNDYNGDGTPDQLTAPAVQRGRYFSLCKSSAGLSGAPKFQASFNSEYSSDIGDGFETFIRGLAKYQGKVTNANTGRSLPQSVTVDGFVGFRTDVGAEVSLFARNLTNRRVDDFAQPMFDLFGNNTGYTAGTKSLGREVGILLRIDY